MAENQKTENAQATGPFVQINAQYIKDLSFETPNHPEILLEMKKAPEISINVDVQAKKVQAKDSYTVDLLVKAQATDPDNSIETCHYLAAALLSYLRMLSKRNGGETKKSDRR